MLLSTPRLPSRPPATANTAPFKRTLPVSCSQMPGIHWLRMASADALGHVPSQLIPAPLNPSLGPLLQVLLPFLLHTSRLPYLSPAARCLGCFRGSSWPVLTP